ncbi:hypothetical protein DP939_42250 [Spongiactinospora rosea]|uniref:Uncharacterized protein n=2 Tax=Spongiactinospora rosea TaxID=2248750 RepID=A0A366LLK0_9ACTN|nr:hypothetical protein DP939_42250 [Spongiactinospora rosea]
MGVASLHYVLPLSSLLAGVAMRRLLIGEVPAALAMFAALSLPRVVTWLGHHAARTPKRLPDPGSIQGHQDALRATIPPPVLRVLDEAAMVVQRQTRAESVLLHDMRLADHCHDGPCKPHWSAGVMLCVPNLAGHSLLLIGRALREQETIGILRFVVAHELHHAALGMRRIDLLMLTAQTIGFLLVGFLAPTLTIAAVGAASLRLMLTLCSWVVELACDKVGVEAHGAEQAEAYFTMLSRGRYRSCARAWPWWQRACSILTWLQPTHPPVWLRIWYCRRVQRGAPGRATTSRAR